MSKSRGHQFVLADINDTTKETQNLIFLIIMACEQRLRTHQVKFTLGNCLASYMFAPEFIRKCVFYFQGSSQMLPRAVATEQQSLVLVKKLLAIAVSSITYLRGLFPEKAYGSKYVEGKRSFETFRLLLN